MRKLIVATMNLPNDVASPERWRNSRKKVRVDVGQIQNKHFSLITNNILGLV